jgi:hypothetical protein
MTRRRTLGLSVALILAGAMAASSGAIAAEPKEPPKCAAIAFRSVPSGMTDGEQDAGLYKSRFGKVEVRATVKQGEAQNYYVVVNGKPLAPVGGAVPKSAEACATQKKMSAPAKATDACTGQRFTTVIDSSGQSKLILLYALQGRDWKFCRAGTV